MIRAPYNADNLIKSDAVWPYALCSIFDSLIVISYLCSTLQMHYSMHNIISQLMRISAPKSVFENIDNWEQEFTQFVFVNISKTLFVIIWYCNWKLNLSKEMLCLNCLFKFIYIYSRHFSIVFRQFLSIVFVNFFVSFQ